MGVDLIQEWERMDEVLAWSFRKSLPKKSRFFFLKVLERKSENCGKNERIRDDNKITNCLMCGVQKFPY
jgi:hypothetical protein